MRPIMIEFQAFGPYAGHEVVDFADIAQKGLFLICGKTGGGKTTILDAMTFALFGKSSGNGRNDFSSMRCTNAEFDDTTFVKFEFENQGEYYIFERRLVRKKKNLSAEYNVMKKDGSGAYQPLLENAKEKELNELATNIIGLDYDQFRQVIVLPQGQFEKLLTSNSKEKEEILISIFGDDKWTKIADKLYENAEARYNQLKAVKERMTNSLQEENCESMEQLHLLIEQKNLAYAELEDTYQKAGYDQIEKDMNAALKVVERFKDLRKMEDKVANLESKKVERDGWETLVRNAKRANKVKQLMEAKTASEKTLTVRQKNVEMAQGLVAHSSKAYEDAVATLKEHLAKESQIKELETLKIQYEGKRADYENIDQVNKEYADVCKRVNQAETEEQRAQKAYQDLSQKVLSQRDLHEELRVHHDALLDQYLIGITGEIAKQLVEGNACPVCGSKSHPQKAVVHDDSVTKAQVDAAETKRESAYNTLQKMMKEQETAQKAYTDQQAVVAKAKEEVAVVATKLDNIKKNMVVGIDSLCQLNQTIEELQGKIALFASQKVTLEQQEKTAAASKTEAASKAEHANQEVEQAQKECEAATIVLENGLKEHGFVSEEEAKAMMLEDEKIEYYIESISNFDASLKNAKESVNEMQEELQGVEEPQEENCQEQLSKVNEARKLYHESKGQFTTEIKRLSDKEAQLLNDTNGMEDEMREAEADFTFAKKLRGDSGMSLQRYVLGIMFTSVVAAANEMLEKVHGGRYRLFRSDDKVKGSNKRGLELKVFDQQSEEHEGRFVGTLSGGEKFLVSLALSIGMSTIAQKSGIRIEALFIDEGFGSLDEDSIGDAMDILNTLQSANGLVGIISHVQLLQDRIPVKLNVEKVAKGSRIVKTVG